MTPNSLMRLAPYLVIALLATASGAENPQLSLAGLTLPDQHGVSHELSPDIRTVLFTADMDASKMVRSVLDRHAPDWLAEQRGVFIADIHRMPGLITRFVALPRMRRYPYRMLLIRDDETGKELPRKTGLVTVLSLADLRVERVRHTKDASELEAWIVEQAGDAPTPQP